MAAAAAAAAAETNEHAEHPVFVESGIPCNDTKTTSLSYGPEDWSWQSPVIISDDGKAVMPRNASEQKSQSDYESESGPSCPLRNFIFNLLDCMTEYSSDTVDINVKNKQGHADYDVVDIAESKFAIKFPNYVPKLTDPFQLRAFHIHNSAEHHFEKKVWQKLVEQCGPAIKPLFAAQDFFEMHFVHLSVDGTTPGIAIALLGQITQKTCSDMDRFLQLRTDAPEQTQQLKGFILKDHMSGPCFSYVGSLTTPLCSTPVLFFIYPVTTLSITKDDLLTLKAGSPRPPMPLHGREVRRLHQRPSDGDIPSVEPMSLWYLGGLSRLVATAEVTKKRDAPAGPAARKKTA